MRVLQVSESLAVNFGGTAAACARLANHLIPLGVETSILTFDGESGDGVRWALNPAIVAKASTQARSWQFGYSPDLPSVVETLAPPDILHLHGLWRLSYLQAARSVRPMRIPIVISVNGMLHERALGRKARLKQVARWLFQDRLLRDARCLHATALEEAQEIRAIGFDGPVAVIPWGVDMPDDDGRALVGAEDEDRRALLYLGRLHPGKGLEVLLRAWAHVRGRFDAWQLIIAGYDEGAYAGKLLKLSSELDLDGSVSYVGPVEGMERERVFARANVVVLPSPAENFGFVVPEALARGVPVIATQGAPWSSLADEQCGWWIPYGVEPLAAALSDALSRAPEELRAMGERGRQFVRGRFAWHKAAASMLELYTWAIGRAPEPAFLQR